MKVFCFVFSLMVVTGCDGKDQTTATASTTSTTTSEEKQAVQISSSSEKLTSTSAQTTVAAKVAAVAGVKTTLEGTVVKKESKAKEGREQETYYVLKTSDAKYRLNSDSIDLSQYVGKKIQAVLVIEEKINKNTGKKRQVVNDVISLSEI